MKKSDGNPVLKIICAAAVLFCSVSCAQKKASADVLRMNISSEPDSFMPWKSSAADTKAILYNIFEGLTMFDTSGAIQPCLAERYSVSPDGLKYVFNIRTDVYFHNGKKLTGADVLYTYKNLAGLDGLAPKSDEMQIIKNAYLEDDYTFAVELKHPSASFLTFAIQPVLQEGYDKNETAPVGTGSYQFSEYSIHQKVVLTKNDAYWNKEKQPHIKTIELYIMSDEAALLSALQSGQLDIAQLLNGANAKALSKKFDFISYPQNMVQILAMNNGREPFTDWRVRKAVSLAIDKHEIIEGALNGLGTELYSNFSPVLKTFYNDELSDINPHDIKKAAALLKEAGYENGFQFTLTVPSNYTAHVDTAQIIAKQLEKIGITAKIEETEWASWLSDVYSDKKYDATVIAFGGKLEPNEILKRYVSTYSKNFVGFKNSGFDECFSKALVELDEEKRISLYKQCQKILAEECPCVFISDPNNCILKNKNAQGFEYYPVTFYDFSKMYFAE